jgi:hypothetical protein
MVKKGEVMAESKPAPGDVIQTGSAEPPVVQHVLAQYGQQYKVMDTIGLEYTVVPSPQPNVWLAKMQ